MDITTKIKTIVQTLDSKKAKDIKVIGVGDLTIIADYFIIASGTSSTQVKALADEVEFALKQNDELTSRIEGYQGANWIVLDYSDIVVHVFHTETRNFYSLERLWQDGEQIDIQKYLK
ncbi:MAG TPA: ribosome silencing factor [Oscillospiraceae bacterium]|nr:ribosome silencing factor [Oscillospiraceae bacterium]